MCAIRSEIDCAIDESASVSAYFDRATMSNFAHRYCMLFVDAFGYDINGQALGLNGYAIQMAIVYDS